MIVLHVCSGNSIFGISPIVKTQGESLRNNNVDIDYFTIKGRGIKGYLRSIPRLNKTLKTKRYDIIHAHYVLCGWIAVFQLSKLPLITSYMGSDAYGFVNAYGRKRLFANYFIKCASKTLQPFVSKIVIKSRNLEKYIYIKNKVNIIPNGVDFEKFRPLNKKNCKEKLNLNTKNRLILFLGNPSNPRKNFRLLNKAYNLIKNDNLEIIKPYPIPFKNIALYLNAVDVLVLTSYLEGSPNVIKEAMACNLPIVSTDVGDVREIIGNTEGCYIISFEPVDVAKKIQMALDFGKRTNGRENIKYLKINNVTKKIISVYQQVLKEK